VLSISAWYVCACFCRLRGHKERATPKLDPTGRIHLSYRERDDSIVNKDCVIVPSATCCNRTLTATRASDAAVCITHNYDPCTIRSFHGGDFDLDVVLVSLWADDNVSGKRTVSVFSPDKTPRNIED
jgi:hypothetical protein